MKRFLKKPNKTIFFVLFFLGLASLFVGSCQRELKPRFASKDKLVQAKHWFNKKYNKSLTLNNEGKLIYGNQYPDWRFIKAYGYKTLEIIETPILEKNRKIYMIQGEDIRPGYNVSLSKLLLARNRYGGYRESVMTIIPRKSYLAANGSLENISLDNIPNNFDGILLFHSWEGRYLNGYTISRGKAIDQLIPKPLTHNSGIGSITETFDVPLFLVNQCGGCDLTVSPNTDQFYQWVCPDDNLALNPCGNMELVNSLNECGGEPNPFDCPCIGGQIDWGMCGFDGDENGGTGGFDPNQAPNITISDSLRDSFPCLYSLLHDSLPNLNREAQMELFYNFNVSERINLKFDIDWTKDSTTTLDAYTDFEVSNIDGYQFNGVIKFNPYYVRNSTKEYTVSTIVHEAIHAYIEYMFQAYTRNMPGIDSAYLAQHFPIHWDYFKHNPIGENLQHRLMAQHYVNTIQNITRIFYNPDADTATANKVSRALAWSGLEKTSVWKTLTDTCDIKAMFWTAKIAHLDVSTKSFGSSCREYNFHYKDSLKLSEPCQ